MTRHRALIGMELEGDPAGWRPGDGDAKVADHRFYERGGGVGGRGGAGCAVRRVAEDGQAD